VNSSVKRPKVEVSSPFRKCRTTSDTLAMVREPSIRTTSDEPLHYDEPMDEAKFRLHSNARPANERHLRSNHSDPKLCLKIKLNSTLIRINFRI
jgi:hypothetical protein